jgi:hypothetical protein
MTALLQMVSGWVQFGWSGGGNGGNSDTTPDKVGAYKADYSRLTDEQLAKEDFQCAELLKHSRPVSR